MCLWKFLGSLEEPVITTLITPWLSSSECHSGFNLTISSYKSTAQELKQYITRLFQLSNSETWECEALEEAAENMLPTRFVDHSLLAHLTLETYTYYNDELHKLSIYPFLIYTNNQLISIGYLDHFDMDFLYLTDTKNTIIDESHLLKEGGNDHE